MTPSIEHTHSNWLPFERMRFLGIPERLDQKLTAILSTEFALGNLIYEAMEGSARTRDSGTVWPERDCVVGVRFRSATTAS